MPYEWPTDEWYKETLAATQRRSWQGRSPGFSFNLQLVITGSPLGTVRQFERFEDGYMTAKERGEISDPDIIVTVSYADYKRSYAELLSLGELPSAVVDGDLEKSRWVLGVQASDQYREHKIALRAMTSWPDDS